MLSECVQSLENLNWYDLRQVSVVTQKLVKDVFAQKQLIEEALDNVVADSTLRGLCEYDDDANKIVIYMDPSRRFSLRLHHFLSGRPDKPHNHRWCFTSVILTGSYTHTLFAAAAELNESATPEDIWPISIRTETAGSVYTLGPDIMHVVEPRPGCVSFVVRGPSIRDRLLVIDSSTLRAYWHYGANHLEGNHNPYTKGLGGRELERVIETMKGLVFA
jgi:hypothetical protein